MDYKIRLFLRSFVGHLSKYDSSYFMGHCVSGLLLMALKYFCLQSIEHIERVYKLYKDRLQYYNNNINTHISITQFRKQNITSLKPSIVPP